MSDLVNYGIRQEESDVRVHVCPYVRRVYTFPTEEGVRALDSGSYEELEGHQNGVEGATSRGYNVPPSDIEKCICIKLREVTWKALEFSRDEPPNVKGQKAVRLVRQMIHNSMLPLPGETKQDPSLEINGTDVIARFPEKEIHVQVKCDFKGGAKDLGGFGLFLQTHERNPRGLHDGENKVQYSDLFGEPALSK